MKAHSRAIKGDAQTRYTERDSEEVEGVAAVVIQGQGGT